MGNDNPIKSAFTMKDGGDDSAEKYRGGRDKDNLVKFINKKLGAEPEETEEVSSENRKGTVGLSFNADTRSIF